MSPLAREHRAVLNRKFPTSRVSDTAPTHPLSRRELTLDPTTDYQPQQEIVNDVP